mmetsp:Transcript_2651/g.9268  ORF Transcript_2651/g.9268 Transcript_2651/m.9268 type:complete len:521 (-) Transcript_2651:3769-5331(-)
MCTVLTRLLAFAAARLPLRPLVGRVVVLEHRAAPGDCRWYKQQQVLRPSGAACELLPEGPHDGGDHDDEDGDEGDAHDGDRLLRPRNVRAHAPLHARVALLQQRSHALRLGQEREGRHRRQRRRARANAARVPLLKLGGRSLHGPRVGGGFSQRLVEVLMQHGVVEQDSVDAGCESRTALRARVDGGVDSDAAQPVHHRHLLARKRGLAHEAADAARRVCDRAQVHVRVGNAGQYPDATANESCNQRHYDCDGVVRCLLALRRLSVLLEHHLVFLHRRHRAVGRWHEIRDEVRLAVVLGALQRREQRELGAVFTHGGDVVAVADDARRATADDAAHEHAVHVGNVRRHQHRRVLPEQLGQRVAERTGRSLRHVNDVSFCIADHGSLGLRPEARPLEARQARDGVRALECRARRHHSGRWPPKRGSLAVSGLHAHRADRATEAVQRVQHDARLGLCRRRARRNAERRQGILMPASLRSHVRHGGSCSSAFVVVRSVRYRHCGTGHTRRRTRPSVGLRVQPS